ncbi:MAG: hypothetical protein ACK5CA_00620 [Cyanobacteriota bacterium]|jgi:hypothetical protein
MFDLQILMAVLATLLLFLTSVVLSYNKLQVRNYDLPILHWAGLSLAGVTFSLLVADQILRGLVCNAPIQKLSAPPTPFNIPRLGYWFRWG